MVFGAVPMGMLMDVVAVGVRVVVQKVVRKAIVALAVGMPQHASTGMRRRGRADYPTKAGEGHQAEQDQHDADGELHGRDPRAPESRRQTG